MDLQEQAQPLFQSSAAKTPNCHNQTALFSINFRRNGYFDIYPLRIGNAGRFVILAASFSNTPEKGWMLRRLREIFPKYHIIFFPFPLEDLLCNRPPSQSYAHTPALCSSITKFQREADQTRIESTATAAFFYLFYFSWSAKPCKSLIGPSDFYNEFFVLREIMDPSFPPAIPFSRRSLATYPYLTREPLPCFTSGCQIPFPVLTFNVP